MTNLLIRTKVAIASVLLLAGASSVLPASPAQNGSSLATEEKALPPSSASDALSSDDIIAQLLLHNQLRDAQLKQYSVVRTYEVRNPEGKLSAQEIARMDFRAPDQKVFQKTSEVGSGFVRHHVFERLMRSESEAASGKEHHDSALTPVNYTFTLVGEEDLGPYHCFVVEVSPKRKDKYLFEGKIWIDAQEFAVVRTAGHPARNPSFWIHRVEFVRQYQRIDGFWLPSRDETTVDVRIHGRRIFTIDHVNYSVNKSEPAEGGPTNSVSEERQPASADSAVSASPINKRPNQNR
jgi:outer membrane lipoprotein-sorting protein